MYDFDDRVVMITGAAGDLGGVVAHAFLRTKAHLVLVDRGEDRLQLLFPELKDNPAHLLATGVDLTIPDDIERMVGAAFERFGRIDILLNIAGAFRAGEPVHKTEVETWDLMLDVNARSAFLTSRAVAPIMQDQGAGVILNVGSRTALKAGKGNAAYSAAKSAVLRLTESLSSELKGDGVNVNAVIPGTIDTAGNRKAMPDADHSRWVPPQDIAEIMLFLASDRAAAIHGAAIPAYGLS